MTLIARNLLQKIDSHSRAKPLRKSTERCLLDVYDYLLELKNRVVKKDYLRKPDYLIGWVFGANVLLKNDHEMNAYYRCNLVLAVSCLNSLIERIKKENKRLSYRSVIKYSQHLRDFMFDVKPVVEHFEQKSDPNFEFFSGDKAYGHQSWRIYREAHALYWSSAYKTNIIPHRIAINLSVFALRQSLELKFKSILGIFAIHDSKLDLPKIRHDYFPEFIEAHITHFKTSYSSLRNIIAIYKWTNFTIHSGVMPRVWEIQYALDYCDALFRQSIPEKGKRWSIHDAIRIVGYSTVLSAFYSKFTSDYPNKTWCIVTHDPEAVIESY